MLITKNEDVVVRYAIRHADGTYSKGPGAQHVPFAKAKTWTNLGHVKTHLQGAGSRYAPGAQVIKVHVRREEEWVESVDLILRDHEAAAKRRRDEYEVREAEAELRAAERNLKAARDRAKRKGVR